MVVFKNWYLLMETVWFGTPSADSPSIVSRLVTAIQESLQLNFGDHGLGSSLPSLQGNMKSCQKFIPKCASENLKQVNLKLGALLTVAQLEAADSITKRALSMAG